MTRTWLPQHNANTPEGLALSWWLEYNLFSYLIQWYCTGSGVTVPHPLHVILWNGIQVQGATGQVDPLDIDWFFSFLAAWQWWKTHFNKWIYESLFLWMWMCSLARREDTLRVLTPTEVEIFLYQWLPVVTEHIIKKIQRNTSNRFNKLMHN